MKITITRGEIKQLVANKMGLNVNDFSLSISEPRKRSIIDLRVGDASKMSLFGMACALDAKGVFTNGIRNEFRPDKKIEAIKTIRQYYFDNGIDCGLQAGKVIMEEWKDFCSYCQNHDFVQYPDALQWRKNNS